MHLILSPLTSVPTSDLPAADTSALINALGLVRLLLLPPAVEVAQPPPPLPQLLPTDASSKPRLWSTAVLYAVTLRHQLQACLRQPLQLVASA